MKAFTSLLFIAAAVQAGVVVKRDDAPDFASLNAQARPTVSGPSSIVAQQTNVAPASQASAQGSAAASPAGSSKKRAEDCDKGKGGSPSGPGGPGPNGPGPNGPGGPGPNGPGPNGPGGPGPNGPGPKGPGGPGPNGPGGPGPNGPGGPGPSAPSKPTGPVATSTPCTTAKTTMATQTSAQTKTSAAATTATGWVLPSTCTNTTPYTPYYPATSTVTGSATGTQTAGAACATQAEAGTYCGFINPNDPCAPQPDGYGPVSSPDTAAGFLANPQWATDAQNVATPAGYTKVFSNANGSVSSVAFLGLHTLNKYDAGECAAACSCTQGCSAFNLFIERDPSINPSTPANTDPTIWGNNCPNPASMTSYKCTLWGGPITAADASNQGGYRDDFQVVIAGSNGYNAAPATAAPVPQPGWNQTHHCSGGGVSTSKHHMGSHFFPGPFDHRVCSAYAEAQTQANANACKSGGTYQACNYWNAYVLRKEQGFFGMLCVLFSDIPDDVDGSYTGGMSSGTNWSVDWSWSSCRDQSHWDTGHKA